MRVLGIDTSTADASVALTDGDEPVSELTAGPGPDGRPQHSRALLAELERAVEAGGGWGEVERIAVGLGPGSYTGLRIGIATARALAQARRIPIAGVGSLAALARGIDAHPTAEGRLALPVLDARSGQVFAALHDPGGAEVWPPFVIEPEELAERLQALDSPPLAAGDGALRFATELEAGGATVAPPKDAVHRISARQVCALGEAAAEVPPGRIEPNYLRAPDANRWLQRDRSEPAG